MSKRMIPYVVRPGDYLIKLAHRLGFDVDAVWNHPANEDLRKIRDDHNLLAPGDVIQVPPQEPQGLPIASGAVNRYTAKVPRIEVRLALHRVDGTVIAGADYEVEGLPDAAGQTDGEGRITLQLPVTTREVVVSLASEEARFTVDVGGLDPISETSGIKHRLQNLGLYLPGERSSADDAQALANAITVFQTRQGLAATGALDDDTREALLDEHRT
jgi:putative peptidoglycan binding protein